MVNIRVKIAIGPLAEKASERASSPSIEQARPIKREPGSEDGRKGERERRRGYWQVGEEDKAV